MFINNFDLYGNDVASLAIVVADVEGGSLQDSLLKLLLLLLLVVTPFPPLSGDEEEVWWSLKSLELWRSYEESGC